MTVYVWNTVEWYLPSFRRCRFHWLKLHTDLLTDQDPQSGTPAPLQGFEVQNQISDISICEEKGPLIERYSHSRIIHIESLLLKAAPGEVSKGSGACRYVKGDRRSIPFARHQLNFFTVAPLYSSSSALFALDIRKCSLEGSIYSANCGVLDSLRSGVTSAIFLVVVITCSFHNNTTSSLSLSNVENKTLLSTELRLNRGEEGLPPSNPDLQHRLIKNLQMRWPQNIDDAVHLYTVPWKLRTVCSVYLQTIVMRHLKTRLKTTWLLTFPSPPRRRVAFLVFALPNGSQNNPEKWDLAGNSGKRYQPRHYICPTKTPR